MRCLITIFLLLSGQVFALNARIFDESKTMDKFDFSIISKYENERTCLDIVITMRSSALFFQGEPGEQSGEEGYVKKSFSSVALVKFVGHPESAYTLMQSGAVVNIESNLKETGLREARLCVHESDLDQSYVLVVYSREQTCPELVYIPVRKIQTKFGQKIY